MSKEKVTPEEKLDLAKSKKAFTRMVAMARKRCALVSLEFSPYKTKNKNHG